MLKRLGTLKEEKEVLKTPEKIEEIPTRNEEKYLERVSSDEVQLFLGEYGTIAAYYTFRVVDGKLKVFYTEKEVSVAEERIDL